MRWLGLPGRGCRDDGAGRLSMRAISGGEPEVYDFLSTVIEDIDTICFWMGARCFNDLQSNHVVKL